MNLKFYEIELKTVPSIRFALSVDFEKHKNRFEYPRHFLEIAVIEEGSMIHNRFDGTVEVVRPGMLTGVTVLDGFSSYSEEGKRQRHTTVGIDAEYNIIFHDTESDFDKAELTKRLGEGRSFLMPYLFRLEENYDKVLNTIKTISRFNLSPDPSDKLKAVGYWHILTGILTDIVLRKLDDSDKKPIPSELVYAENAIRYINEHYRERLSVACIARHLKISEGHLHRIFKSTKGISIIAYINRLKVNTAISLMKNRGLSLMDAAYNVGIEDLSYMSRLFKNVTGVGVREYMKKTDVLSDY